MAARDIPFGIWCDLLWYLVQLCRYRARRSLADDSWGRFWGWDPKENGALLIVIWNALMLHARWDSMVAARGFSILAIGGNIVTAWSYFGTNELGIGLHSYGFTSGVLMWLSVFMASQAMFMILGFVIPPRTEIGDSDGKSLAEA